jgi:hypothetical protein
MQSSSINCVAREVEASGYSFSHNHIVHCWSSAFELSIVDEHESDPGSRERKAEGGRRTAEKTKR